MQFKDIIGHDSVKSRFIQTVKENRVSHAQMLIGPAGVGKLPLAIAFAQYVSCLDKKENDSCGLCSSCRKYQKLVHPDLHFVFPVVKGKGFTNPVSDNFIESWRNQIESDQYFNLGDWYNSIGVDNSQGMIYSGESNEIIRKLNLKTYESDYKIMIIWLPEKMHTACANKLLKMIEEPPVKTLFFMVSEEPDKILQTILSRTQMVKVSKIDNEAMGKALHAEFSLNEKEHANVVRLAEGSYRKARILIENSEENAFNFENFVTIMRHCYARKVLDIMEWAEEIAGIGREKQ
jgi:DNA polymerase-3 subunit delta'